MARHSKIPPMELQLDFAFDAGAATPGQTGSWSGYVDIAQCLALLNRKGLRQGQQFFVESWSLSSNVAAEGSVWSLSNTWVLTNAWEKALRTWLKSQEQLTEFDDLKGRYHDFKVKFFENHDMSQNLLPIGIDFAAAAGISPTISANWQGSHIQIPNVDVAGTPTTVEYEIHLIGPDTATSKGCIEGYANGRSRPMQDEPNIVAADSWMEFAFDDGDNLADIRSDVVTENDSPPYLIDAGETAFEFYPGGSNAANGAGSGVRMSPTLAVNPSLQAQATRYGSAFLASCGLLYLSGTAYQALEGQPNTWVKLRLNIAAGPAKGVMARRMQDVN